MAATYQTISKTQMKEALSAMAPALTAHSKGWKLSTKPCKELVYDLPLTAFPGVVVRVYTSIDRASGMSRPSGGDAIRVCAVDLSHRNDKGVKVGRGVIKTKRVHRTQNWTKNLTKRIVATVKHGLEVMAKREAKGEYQRVDTVSIAASTKVTCTHCGGTGVYKWGASVNGVMTHSGPCYQCEGKGYQTDADQRRNWGYQNYAIGQAFAAMTKPLDPEDIPEAEDGEYEDLAELADFERRQQEQW